MRSLLFAIVALCLARVPCIRAEDARSPALAAADAERVAAMKSADREKLAAFLSDDLRYAHSSGTVDTKQSFIESLTTGRTKYLALDYEERAFTFPTPKIALMTGRAHLKVANATGEADMLLGFLGVWREENGKWRFLAWQSCKLPVPAAR
ncbi:MAG: nuclear transport factor 2 family protein [Chthoniobacteraceae bacterium]